MPLLDMRKELLDFLLLTLEEKITITDFPKSDETNTFIGACKIFEAMEKWLLDKVHSKLQNIDDIALLKEMLCKNKPDYILFIAKKIRIKE